MRAVTQVFGAKVVDYALKFAISVLIARALGPADKGVLSFAQLVVNWTILLGNFSLMDANIFLMGSRKFGNEEATLTCAVFSAAAGLGYALILFGVVFFGWVKWPVGHASVFFLLLVMIPFVLSSGNAASIVQGLGRFLTFNILALLCTITSLIGVLLAVWLARDRLNGVVWALVTSSAVNAVVILGYLARAAKQKWKFSWPYLKAALSFGLRGHVRLFLSQVSFQFDQLALGVLLAPVFLGWYSVARSLCEGLLMLPEAISVVLFPRVAADKGTAGPMTAQASRINLALMMLAAGMMALLATPFIGKVYGQNFLKAVQPLRLLLPAIVCRAFSRVLINYIYGIGRPQLCVWSTGVTAAVMVLTIFPLVRLHGLMGAALANVLGYAAGAVVDLVIACKVSALPVRSFLLLRAEDLRKLLRRQ
jgi:O-antigen/teichoic acid export membrane protein